MSLRFRPAPRAQAFTSARLRAASPRDAGVELHLATRRGDGERWSTLAPGAEIHPVAPDSRAPRIAWEQVGARKLAATVEPDVWHGPHYTMPWRLGVPAVVTVHDLTFFDHPEWHERTKVPFFRRMIRTSARARGRDRLRERVHREAVARGRASARPDQRRTPRCRPRPVLAGRRRGLRPHTARRTRSDATVRRVRAGDVGTTQGDPDAPGTRSRASRPVIPTCGSRSWAATGGGPPKYATRSRPAGSRRTSCAPATSTTTSCPRCTGARPQLRTRRWRKGSACRRSKHSPPVRRSSRRQAPRRKRSSGPRRSQCRRATATRSPPRCVHCSRTTTAPPRCGAPGPERARPFTWARSVEQHVATYQAVTA